MADAIRDFAEPLAAGTCTCTCTVEAKITFTYRLRRTVKVRLVSFPFYGQPFFGTLRKRLKNGKSTVKRRLKKDG